MADLINSLIGYVNDVKPFHTKIFGVEVEYVVEDHINVSVTEDFRMKIFMGLPVNEMKQIGEWSRERWVPGIVGPTYDSTTNTWDFSQWDEGYIGDPISTNNPGVPMDRPNRAHEAIMRSIYGTLDIANTPVEGRYEESYRQSVVYPRPTGFMDMAFVSVTEDLKMSIDFSGGDVDDIHNFVNPLWDETYDGLDIAGTGDKTFYLNGDYEEIFNNIPSFNVQSSPNLNIGYGSTSYDQRSYDEFDGKYTVINAVYDISTDTTLIRVLESVPVVVAGSFVYGKIMVGLWDAGEWDGYKDTLVQQPDADLNASPTITECLDVVDGYMYDSPQSAGFDSGGFDEAHYVLRGKNTIRNQYEGFDYSLYDTDLWDSEPFFIRDAYDKYGYDYGLMDSGTNVHIMREQDVGIVVFSYDDIPTPNPILSYKTNIQEESTEWVINHNRGYNPIVRVYDTTGNEISPSEVIHTSKNTTLIQFSQPTTGYVRLI